MVRDQKEVEDDEKKHCIRGFEGPVSGPFEEWLELCGAEPVG